MMLIGSIVKSRHREFMFQAIYLVHWIQLRVLKLQINLNVHEYFDQLAIRHVDKSVLFLFIFIKINLLHFKEIFYNFGTNRKSKKINPGHMALSNMRQTMELQTSYVIGRDPMSYICMYLDYLRHKNLLNDLCQ